MPSLLQAQSDDDDVADDVSVNVGAPDDFMTEFFAEVSDELIRCHGALFPASRAILNDRK